MEKDIQENKNEEVKTEEISESEKDEKDCCDDLEACKKDLEAEKDKYLRAHADFDNMKKRLEKDKATAVAFANETFARDLLSVIDSFESALSSIEQIESAEASDAIEKIKEGLVLTYDQMIKVLKKHHVEEVENEGVFDPNFHQVVHQVESDEHESGEIVNVLQKGYKLKDRLLRPSMVGTCK